VRTSPPTPERFVWVTAPRLWVEVPFADGWIAAYRLGVDRGRPVVTELRVFPDEPGRRWAGEWSGEYLGTLAQAPLGGLTARLVRRLKPGEHQRHGDAMLDWLRSEFMGEQEALDFFGLGAGRLAQRAPKATGPRRSRPTNRFYAEVAAFYVNEHKRGNKAPLKAVAAKWKCPYTAARRFIHDARQRGMLTLSERGVMGGMLTPEAKRILEPVKKGDRKR
jgi:hypothetical protein